MTDDPTNKKPHIATRTLATIGAGSMLFFGARFLIDFFGSALPYSMPDKNTSALDSDDFIQFLSLVTDGKSVSLGERIHHYTLVTLARVRSQDAQRGLAPQSQGWIALDELSRMLGVEPSYVNIQIFRAKHQISNALPSRAVEPPLVERRRGDVRFGNYPFLIHGGAHG